MARHTILTVKRIPPRLGNGVVVLSTIRVAKSGSNGTALLESGGMLRIDLDTLFADDHQHELLDWLADAHMEYLRSINRVQQLIQRESPYRVGGPKQHPWHHSNYTARKLAAALRAGDKAEV